MNAPSAPARAEMASLDRIQPDHSSRIPARGGWRWLLGKPSQPVSAVQRRPRMRQCGRAVLIWMAAWYGVFHLFPLLCEHRWQRIGPYYEERKWPALRRVAANQADRPLLLALGSSRIAWALWADRLNGMPDSDGRPMSVYNFGIPTSGSISQLAYFRQMIAEGIRPRLLLLEIFPSFLCEPERGALTEETLFGFENLGIRRFLQWLPYLYRPEKMASLWIAGRVFPWYAFRHSILLEGLCWAKGLPCPSYGPIDPWGWHLCLSLPFPAPVRKFRVEMDRLGYSPGLRHFRPGQKSLKALREILELCRREKIPAVLLWTPESSEFRGWYSEEAKAKLHGILDELRQTYGVAVIDATTWLPDVDFEDGHHVLRHGADVFTSRLRAELPRLLEQTAAAKAD